MPRHYEDFMGKDINGIKVLRLVENSGGAGEHKKWVCECSLCHNEYVVQSNHLKEKKFIYCPECMRSQRENLTGKKYGHLTVDHMLPAEKYKRTFCSCTCDCGSTNIIVQANHLKSGETRSCGCLLSFPEEQISALLTENNIIFEKQKSFPDLRYKHPLRFDFYLPDNNTIIEYNGEQHYKPIDYYGGKDQFKIYQIRDKLKREYCINNSIGYIVIRFDEDIEESLIKNNIIMKR